MYNCCTVVSTHFVKLLYLGGGREMKGLPPEFISRVAEQVSLPGFFSSWPFEQFRPVFPPSFGNCSDLISFFELKLLKYFTHKAKANFLTFHQCRKTMDLKSIFLRLSYLNLTLNLFAFPPSFEFLPPASRLSTGSPPLPPVPTVIPPLVAVQPSPRCWCPHPPRETLHIDPEQDFSPDIDPPLIQSENLAPECILL